jgi:hypothetical protein
LDIHPFQLPDAFKDFTSQRNGGKDPSGPFKAHCNREVYHAQWRILLDDEFVHAYEHGIVIKCCDGVTRRFYPRIFTFSADFPEKCVGVMFSIVPRTYKAFYRILLATMRSRGLCICPRCLMPLSRFGEMGMVRDTNFRKAEPRVDGEEWRSDVRSARKVIYEENYAIDNATVESMLKDRSWVPTTVSHTNNIHPNTS